MCRHSHDHRQFVEKFSVEEVVSYYLKFKISQFLSSDIAHHTN